MSTNTTQVYVFYYLFLSMRWDITIINFMFNPGIGIGNKKAVVERFRWM